MNGVILAGGFGTRLYPVSSIVNKHLLPVYDKPMIYYPLSTLMLAGVRKILIISTSKFVDQFQELFGNGHRLGLDILYEIQEFPSGIPDAFRLIPADFLEEPLVLILGDNLLYGMGLGSSLKDAFGGRGCLAFAYKVKDPSMYGVVEFTTDGQVRNLTEKPQNLKSGFAIPGFYFFDGTVSTRAKKLIPSDRGETEIIDVLKDYLESGELTIKILERGTAWLDTGTPTNILEASEFVRVIEDRQGFKIACPEEIAFNEGYITLGQLTKLASEMPRCEYRKYLDDLILESKI